MVRLPRAGTRDRGLRRRGADSRPVFVRGFASWWGWRRESESLAERAAERSAKRQYFAPKPPAESEPRGVAFAQRQAESKPEPEPACLDCGAGESDSYTRAERDRDPSEIGDAASEPGRDQSGGAEPGPVRLPGFRMARS